MYKICRKFVEKMCIICDPGHFANNVQINYLYVICEIKMGKTVFYYKKCFFRKICTKFVGRWCQNMYKKCWVWFARFGGCFFSQYLYEICGLWLQSVSTHKFYTNIHTNFIQIFRNGRKSTAPSPSALHF